MRILLDESLPRQLAAEFPAHEVRTVRQLGWSGLKNGDLLERASGRFDVMLTADQNLEHQQNLGRFNVAVVVVVAFNNRIDSLTASCAVYRKAPEGNQGRYAEARERVTKTTLNRQARQGR